MFSEVKVREIRKNEENLTRVVIRVCGNETKPLRLTNLSGADYMYYDRERFLTQVV